MSCWKNSIRKSSVSICGTFNQIDETRWAALDEILKSDMRLQAKPETVASA